MLEGQTVDSVFVVFEAIVDDSRVEIVQLGQEKELGGAGPMIVIESNLAGNSFDKGLMKILTR